MRLYVGSQNDALYLIDQPPRPSTDDINPDHDTNAVAKVYLPNDDENARRLAACWNAFIGWPTEKIEQIQLALPKG